MELTTLHGMTANRLHALTEAGIRSASDLVMTFPRRYMDRSNVMPIGMVTGSGERVTVFGTIHHIEEVGFGRNKRLEVTLRDETGFLKGVWFKGVSYFLKRFKAGETVAFFGIAKRYGRSVTLAHPDVEVLEHQGQVNTITGVIPVYPGTQRMKNTYITGAVIQKWVRQCLAECSFPEFMPAYLLEKMGYPDRTRALYALHVPDTVQDPAAALNRFKFEEFFLFQLAMVKLKKHVIGKNPGIVFTIPGPLTRQFFNEVMPFELTDGQKTALGDIKQDLRSGRQMNRLIQGDVGSGKTIVSIGAMLMAVDSGYQTAMMAPTEILAEQHYFTLKKYLEPMGLHIRLLLGSQKAALRRDIHTDVEGGRAQVVIGTHAVIQDQVRFHRLGLVVIDEQHRFGVLQRSQLQRKGTHPHMLVMSATPIPRSLAMTLYSDLDISLVKGLPGGRQPVKTVIRYEKNRKDVYDFIEGELKNGGQSYVVYPLVDESEALDLKDATEGHNLLKQRFDAWNCGLLHGRMSTEEKESVMKAFTLNQIQVLVSTTVIEVGVDVPNASVMLIEHAERFGLSQLHQLRGRIGRGSRQSYCILMSDVKQSKDARVRLHTMAETNDGFVIAETDLKLRGPGDFLGTKQSGLPDFRYADLVEDQPLLEQAKKWALDIMDTDPGLSLPEHKQLKKAFETYFKEKSPYFQMG